MRELRIHKTKGTLTLEDAPITIGRASENDIVLPMKDVSRRHCVIEVVAGAARVRDVGSHYGTKVNGASVKEAPLRSGDRIGVGPYELVYVDPDAEEAPAVVTVSTAATEPPRPRGVTPDMGTDPTVDPRVHQETRAALSEEKRRRKDAEERIEALDAAAAERDDALAAAQRELADAQAALAQVTTVESDAGRAHEETVTALRHGHEEAVAALRREHQEALDALRRDHDQALAALRRDLEKESSARENERSTLSAEVASVQAQLDKAREKSTRLAADLDAARKELDTAQREVKAITKDRQTVETQRAALEERIEASLARLRAEAANLGEASAYLAETVDAIEAIELLWVETDEAIQDAAGDGTASIPQNLLRRRDALAERLEDAHAARDDATETLQEMIRRFAGTTVGT